MLIKNLIVIMFCEGTNSPPAQYGRLLLTEPCVRNIALFIFVNISLPNEL